jgi:hypothetical protein
MQPADSRKKLLIVIGIIFGALAIITVVIALVNQLLTKNEYGDAIKIQNLDQKVKNVSDEFKDGVEATLYNVVKKNVEPSVNLSKLDDAFIRDGSDSQDYEEGDTIYSGKFIVDMESIKQSYLIQYTYIQKGGSIEGLTDRVVITCVEEKDLKFGAFKCEDPVTQQAGKNDSIIQHLPYSNFSFNIAADATKGDDNLIIKVALRIPESDLKGDLASKQAVVAMYKNEVTKWLTSKNITPSDYTFEYNYNDNGDPLVSQEFDQHGNSDIE